MFNEFDVLKDVTHRLNSAGLPFMLSGSLAMTYYAKPRMTRDIDIVIGLSGDDARRIVEAFEPEYYVSLNAVVGAVTRRSMFNLIHQESVFKVDCIVLKDDPFRQEEFARRKEVTFGDFQTWIVSCEDLILSKLIWAQDFRSEMQLRDVRNLLATKCDAEYVRSRAVRLGVAELLMEIWRNE